MKSYIICGLGGSGSRLLGEIFSILGFDLGNRLNYAYDNLDTFAATSYYKGINPLKEDNYPAFKKIFLEQLDASYTENTIVIKEPNYHMFLPFLKKISDETDHEMKFIHIIRDGLYMMHSENDNQFKRWKKYFTLKEKDKRYQRLEYWYLANKRAINLYKILEVEFILVEYENLLSNPEKILRKILEFINKDSEVDKLRGFIKKIESFNPKNTIETWNNINDPLKNNIQNWLSLIRN